MANRTIRLIRLGVPIAVGRLGIVGMGVVDTIVVGQLAPRELAHQALGWTLNGPAMIGGIGLLLGVQVLAARAVGAGATSGLGAIWRRGLVIALAAGALVCLSVWLFAASLLQGFGVEAELARRAAAVGAVLTLSVPLHLAFMASAKLMEALERPTPGAAAMWLANGVNLALDLILVPEWGAIGSAWATVSSRLFLALALPAYMLAVPAVRRLLAGPPAIGAFGYRALLAIGVAAALSAVVEAGAFAAMSVIAARAGGTTAVAVWAIATGSLVTLAYLLAQGLATASVVLVSEAVGAGDDGEASRIGWTAMVLTAVAMGLCGLGCVAFAPQVAGAFTVDAATAAALTGAMGLVAVLMLPDGVQGAADAVLRARSVNWFPTVARLAAFVVVAPLLALALTTRFEAASAVLTATILAGSAALAAMVGRLGFLKAPVAAPQK